MPKSKSAGTPLLTRTWMGTPTPPSRITDWRPITVSGLVWSLGYINSLGLSKASTAFSSTQSMVTYTTSNGAPVSEPYAAQRAGLNGPLLLQGMHASSTILLTHSLMPCRKISITSTFSLTLTVNVSLSVLYVVFYTIIYFPLISFRSMPKELVLMGISKSPMTSVTSLLSPSSSLSVRKLKQPSDSQQLEARMVLPILLEIPVVSLSS